MLGRSDDKHVLAKMKSIFFLLDPPAQLLWNSVLDLNSALQCNEPYLEFIEWLINKKVLKPESDPAENIWVKLIVNSLIIS